MTTPDYYSYSYCPNFLWSSVSVLSLLFPKDTLLSYRHLYIYIQANDDPTGFPLYRPSPVLAHPPPRPLPIWDWSAALKVVSICLDSTRLALSIPPPIIPSNHTPNNS